MIRQRQLIRAWLVASTATGFGATSHLLAGGHLPHPLILALVTSLAAVLTLAFTRLKLSRLSLAAGVLVGQGLLHGLYSHAQPFLLPASGQPHLSHIHTAPVIARDTPADLQGPGMWIGHLCAALVTYAVLAYGEQLYSLLKVLLRAAQRLFSRILLRGFLPASRYLPGFLHPLGASGFLFVLGNPLRGPPALAKHL